MPTSIWPLPLLGNSETPAGVCRSTACLPLWCRRSAAEPDVGRHAGGRVYVLQGKPQPSGVPSAHGPRRPAHGGREAGGAPQRRPPQGVRWFTTLSISAAFRMGLVSGGHAGRPPPAPTDPWALICPRLCLQLPPDAAGIFVSVAAAMARSGFRRMTTISQPAAQAHSLALVRRSDAVRREMGAKVTAGDFRVTAALLLSQPATPAPLGPNRRRRRPRGYPILCFFHCLPALPSCFHPPCMPFCLQPSASTHGRR